MGEKIKIKAKRMNWKAKTAIILCFTLIFSLFMHEGWYNPRQSRAITFSAGGSIAYGTTPLTPGYPSGIVANDLLVLVVGMKPTTAGTGNSSVTTPTGWTALGSIYGTTGTLGADTGPTNLFTFYRNAAGTESGTLSVTTTGANSAWAQIYRFTGNTVWSVAQATGEDTTAGAAISIAFGTNPGVQQGDYILAAMCVPTDIGAGNQFSAQAFTQTGVTFGTVTEISEPYTNTGNDLGGFVVWANVASGTATGSPTMTATAGGTTTNIYGPGVFIRIRETNPPIPGPVTVSPDTGTYTSASPTITTSFREDSSNITSCQYTTNGTTWLTGTLSGSRPDYTCTANPTGLSGSLTINMRATSGDGTGTATAITRTVDNTPPTTPTLTVTPGTDQNALSWTASTDSGSGLKYYDVRMLQGATPPADCSSGTSIYTGTATTYTHSNLTPVAGGYSYRVCAYDNLNHTSSSTGTGLPTWSSTTTSCGRCHGYTSSFNDGTARNNPEGTFVGDHNAHVVKAGAVCSVCHVTPATETSADYNHRDGNIQMKPGATAISGGYYDKNNNAAYNAGTDDTWLQTNTPTTASCRNISCHGANNPTPQWGVGTVDCTGCHNGVINSPVAATLDPAVTTRRNVVAEFASTWSHKRSASGAVTKYDCIVCHMEGDMSTGGTTTSHMNGYIDLRDPDTGIQVMEVTFSGDGGTWNQTTPHTAAGSYSSTTTPLQFVRFNRDLSVRLEADPNWQISAAIQVNQCLKCHDADGATSSLAQVPGGSALKPFGTTITGHVSPYNSNGNGNVVNVAESFASTNSSYHPVTGRQNNSYAQGTMMVSPWDMTKTNGNNTQYGYLMSCWDCHAPSGATGVQTSTVTAHGAAATLRAPVFPGGTPNSASTNLCLNCHVTTYATTSANHPTGSAFQGGNNNMNATTMANCAYCHSYTAPEAGTASITLTSRPLRAENVHGFNDRIPGIVGSRWVNGTNSHRPYAFIRNTLSYWSPTSVSAPGETLQRSRGCTGTGGTCNNNMNTNTTYTTGGVY